MRSKPSRGLRWRVSVYPPGVADNLPAQYPLVHKASRDLAVAREHFEKFAAQIGGGKVGRVILHQGKLYMGRSQYIEMDTAWFPDKWRV